MNRYLLFNAGCGSCSGIAGKIEKETDGLLVGRSLTELEIQQYLNTAFPKGWKLEPMVLEVSDNGKDTKVYSGVYMRLRLIQLLGISKAWRIASLVYESVKPLVPAQQRRTFLRYSGGLMAGLAVLGLKPMQVHAEYVLESPDSSTTARHLAGSELQNAVTEATGDTEYGPLRS